MPESPPKCSASQDHDVHVELVVAVGEKPASQVEAPGRIPRTFQSASASTNRTKVRRTSASKDCLTFPFFCGAPGRRLGADGAMTRYLTSAVSDSSWRSRPVGHAVPEELDLGQDDGGHGRAVRDVRARGADLVRRIAEDGDEDRSRCSWSRDVAHDVGVDAVLRVVGVDVPGPPEGVRAPEVHVPSWGLGLELVGVDVEVVVEPVVLGKVPRLVGSLSK